MLQYHDKEDCRNIGYVSKGQHEDDFMHAMCVVCNVDKLDICHIYECYNEFAYMLVTYVKDDPPSPLKDGEGEFHMPLEVNNVYKLKTNRRFYNGGECKFVIFSEAV